MEQIDQKKSMYFCCQDLFEWINVSNICMKKSFQEIAFTLAFILTIIRGRFKECRVSRTELCLQYFIVTEKMVTENSYQLYLFFHLFFPP